ncbi:MAG: hypothetical protein Q8K63_00815 [Acidimicrobiales bacterium]|nr:hypothetical protein [Acidimicrobiales bacterium]
MRRLLLIGIVLAFVGGMQSPATALSFALPPLSVTAVPNAIPPGNTFEVNGRCYAETDRVSVQMVRQARPGVGAKVLQSRTLTLDSERGYRTTFINNLTTAPGFPVDAQVFASCGDYTAHTPFVSTQLVYPNERVRILTLQADGPCGTCVAHVKAFDAYANLSTFHNSYVKDWPRSGSLAALSRAENTPTVVATSPGPLAVVNFFPFGIVPYGEFTGGVEFAWGDFQGDSALEVVTGPGAGGGPHIKVFSAQRADNTPTFGPSYNEIGGFFAYAPEFLGGVRVAVGDVVGSDEPEIITAPGPGGGPHIRVFSLNGTLLRQFLAYAPNVTGGVSVAVGDVVAGGKHEIVTGAGPGGAAHVRTFTWSGQPVGAGFYAYDPSFTGGVWVAAGDVDSQGGHDIVTGAGAGGMPHVRVFTSPDGAFTSPGFFAYEDLPTGVRVAVPR